MQGVLETLTTGIVSHALGSALGLLLMAAPARKAVRPQLKKIYVLNEMGDMDGEYVLDPECPIDYNDFLKVLPDEGIGDREALFVGEYVFTAFQSGKWVFVLLSRGQLGQEDMDWTATLLTAADAHLAAETRAGAVPRPVEAPRATAEVDSAIAKRQAELEVREKELAKLEVQLKADQANLSGRSEELERQKARVVALADYVAQIEATVASGVARSEKALQISEQMAASVANERSAEDAQAVAQLRQQFDEERKALLSARNDLETKYREATERVRQLEIDAKASAEAQAKERAETAARETEAERARSAIEARVQELSLRFAAMAKERLVTSHRPAPAEGPPGVEAEATDASKEALAKERKFLQRRAIEMLDREERIRERETSLDAREASLAKREQDLSAREASTSRVPATPAMPPGPEAEAARKDIEQRVKIIQQKALDLLDREEKLRKRAAELEALEARLSGNVAAR